MTRKQKNHLQRQARKARQMEIAAKRIDADLEIIRKAAHEAGLARRS